MNIKYFFSLGLIVLLSVTINGQTYFSPDRHSTNSFDGWMSCTPTANPNTDRGVSHWTMFNLGEEYTLSTSHIWNVNDPDNLDAGIKDLAVDYSDDGITWNHLGVFNMDQSDGSLFYLGTIGPHFANIQTQYLLFTSLDNYGASCHGFSELKINIANSPLPLSLVSFEVNCIDQNTNQITWRTENEFDVNRIELERSEDVENWTSIYTTKSNNDNKEINFYQTNDVVDKNYYYRLKTSDNSGKINYSDIVSSDCISSERGLAVSPNPADNISFVSFGSKGMTSFEYTLYDVTGKAVYKESRNVDGDFTKFSINTNDYLPGEYYVNIKWDKELLVKKLIVL